MNNGEGSRNAGEHFFRFAQLVNGELSWLRIDLDMKQRLRGLGEAGRLRFDGAVKNVRFLLERVNRRVFGRRYLKGEQVLNAVVAVERGPVGGRLHVHGLIEVPGDRKPSEFRTLMDEQWAKCRERYGRSEFKLLTVEEAQSWAGYTTKSGWQPDLIHIRKGSR